MKREIEINKDGMRATMRQDEQFITISVVSAGTARGGLLTINAFRRAQLAGLLGRLARELDKWGE